MKNQTFFQQTTINLGGNIIDITPRNYEITVEHHPFFITDHNLIQDQLHEESATVKEQKRREQEEKNAILKQYMDFN